MATHRIYETDAPPRDSGNLRERPKNAAVRPECGIDSTTRCPADQKSICRAHSRERRIHEGGQNVARSSANPYIRPGVETGGAFVDDDEARTRPSGTLGQAARRPHRQRRSGDEKKPPPPGTPRRRETIFPPTTPLQRKPRPASAGIRNPGTWEWPPRPEPARAPRGGGAWRRTPRRRIDDSSRAAPRAWPGHAPLSGEARPYSASRAASGDHAATISPRRHAHRKGGRFEPVGILPGPLPSNAFESPPRPATCECRNPRGRTDPRFRLWTENRECRFPC